MTPLPIYDKTGEAEGRAGCWGLALANGTSAYLMRGLPGHHHPYGSSRRHTGGTDPL